MSKNSEVSGVNIPAINTHEAVEILVEDMLCTFHTDGENPELDAKVEAAYQEHKGVKFFKKTPAATNLKGFPGQGKTSAMKVAAKMCAELLGLTYVLNPSNDFTATKEHLLFVSLELSGEVSAVSVGGIPRSVEYKDANGETQEYMGKLVEKRLMMLKDAGAGVFLLDDFSNASPSVQNVGLSIVEEKRFQGMSIGRSYCGLTGNLGAVDGTNISNTSTANATRVKTYIVTDTLDNWLGRTVSQYNDDIGDAGIMGFFRRNSELFHKPTKSKNGEPYPCARSWSKFVEELRSATHMYRELSKNPSTSNSAHAQPLKEIVRASAGIVGIEASQKLEAHYSLMLEHGADKIARQVIDDGEFSAESKEKINQKLGNGISAQETSFGQALVCAVSEYAADSIYRALKNGDDAAFDKASKGFANGIFGFIDIEDEVKKVKSVDSAQVNLGVARFAMRLGMLGKDDEKIASIRNDGKPWPVMDVIERVHEHVCKHPTARIAVAKDNGRDITRVEMCFEDVITQKDRYVDEANFSMPGLSF